jgi:hypothetical protein
MATQTVAMKAQVENLPSNSAPQGFNLLATITAADLTASTADDLNSFTSVIPAKSRISDVLLVLDTPFENTADSANDSTTISVGDGSAVTTFLSATQVNLNGTEVLIKTMTGSATAYATANTLKIVFTPKTSTALTALNKGKVRIYVKLITAGQIG